MTQSLFCDLTLPQIQTLMPYIPGKPISELQREFGLTHVSKLASNENPLGASPMVLKAIESEMLNVSRYPDGNAYYLRDAIAKFIGRDFNQVAVGNGSNELLTLIARVFAGPLDEVIYSQYAFAVYPISAKSVGAIGVEVPSKDWGHDLNAMAAAVTERTKLIYIANPNNPTGTCFTQAEWHNFMAKIPQNVVVVLDEAYVEYVNDDTTPNGLDYLDAAPNLLISRTFSKAYGLASLRVGYLVGCEEIIQYINKLREPFNVNSFAQAAAVAALADQQFVASAVALNAQGMAALMAFFQAHAIEYIPSQGNFICFNAGEFAADWHQQFLKSGVILRPVSNYGMQGYIRVSVGNEAEMAHFLTVFNQILQAQA